MNLVDHIFRNSDARLKKISACDENFVVAAISKFMHWIKKLLNLNLQSHKNLAAYWNAIFLTGNPKKAIVPQTLLITTKVLQLKNKLTASQLPNSKIHCQLQLN